MHYPAPTTEDARRLEEDGFLVVRNVIDAEELEALVAVGHELIRLHDNGRFERTTIPADNS